MFPNIPYLLQKSGPLCLKCRRFAVTACNLSQNIDDKFTVTQKVKILEVMNGSELEDLISYDVAKTRLKKFEQWKRSKGDLKCLSDIQSVEGFTQKSILRLFNSIIGEKEVKAKSDSNRIKGQVLHPKLSESVIQSCKTAMAVYISVNSVCWALLDKSNYEVLEWKYYPIDYPEGKRFQITDIYDISSRATQCLPLADVYVMKAEATTLRAAGSDPNNPKVLAINLQKAQMVAMIVALLNARHQSEFDSETKTAKEKLAQKVYFLRPSLPYRLYGTLIGMERVSSHQTIEMLLQNGKGDSTTDARKLRVSESLKTYYMSQNDLQKDMLGHCLLLGLTFMNVCVYKNVT